MKKFNIIKTDLGEITGLGTYEYRKDRKYIFIDTTDSSISDFFENITDEKKKLSTIGFSGLESDAKFSGSFMVETIERNMNTHKIEINIKE